jgi:hypothetical protein
MIPLVADKVSIPAAAGEVDLLSVLPDHVADMYRSPLHLLKQQQQEQQQSNKNSTPKGRVHAERSEYIKLIRRMIAAGMIEWTDAPEVVNGLFGVPKPDGSIRLIVDGRPACDRFVDPPHVALPTPDLLPKLSLPTAANNNQKQPVFVAKSDLSDFFYRFRVPKWMLPYFALPPIKVSEMSDVLGARFGGEGAGDGLVYPCLMMLAMGWSHSVYLAQTAHEHLLNTRTRLAACDRITSSNDLRIDRVRHMVYVDDLIIIGTDRDEVNQLQAEYITMAEATKLPLKPAKIMKATADGVDCLGIELHGRNHTIAPSIDKLIKLRDETYRFIHYGFATGRELAALVGRWTWLMLVQRPSLSIFNHVYRYIQSANRSKYELWPSVKTELWCVARIAPLLIAHITNQWYPAVIAVDASLSGQGVTSSLVDDVNDLQFAAQAAGTASIRTGLLIGSLPLPLFPIMDDVLVNDESESPVAAIAAEEAAAVVDTAITHQLKSNELMLNGGGEWRTLISSAWHSGIENEEHINSYEVRSVSTAVRRVLSQPHQSIRHRLMILSDSQVAVGCCSKGRTSSPTLLRRLRPLAALLLASGLQLFLRWIPSHLNPADEPSRRFEPGRIKSIVDNYHYYY